MNEMNLMNIRWKAGKATSATIKSAKVAIDLGDLLYERLRANKGGDYRMAVYVYADDRIVCRESANAHTVIDSLGAMHRARMVALAVSSVLDAVRAYAQRKVKFRVVVDALDRGFKAAA